MIVGAGPIGLLTAHAAVRRGCRDILVLEQAREFKPAGQDIDIQLNGIRAMGLVAPAVLEALKDGMTTDRAGRWAALSSAGVVEQMYGGELSERLVVNWYRLQCTLRELMPDMVEVRTNAQVVSLADMYGNATQVTYTRERTRFNPYTQWGEETQPVDPDINILEIVRGRIVVGADGIHSRCREWVYHAIGGPSWGYYSKPLYAGLTLARWLFKGVPESANRLAERMDVLDLPFLSFESNSSDPLRLLHRCLVVRAPTPEGIRLTLVAIVAAPEPLSRDPELVREELMRAVEHELEYEPVIEFIASVARGEVTPDVDVCYPQYVVPAMEPLPFLTREERDLPADFWRPYGRKRVFLIGDALHGCPPLLGQGVSMGCEDVCELVELMAEKLRWKGPLSVEKLASVEEQYREIRRNRLCLVQKYSVNLQPFSDRQKKEELDRTLKNWTPVAGGWEKIVESSSV